MNFCSFAIPKAFDFPGKAEALVQKGYPRIRMNQLKELPFIILPLSTFLGETLRLLCEKEAFFLPAILSNVQTCRPLIISQNRDWVSL